MYLSFLAVIMQPLTGIMHSRSTHLVILPNINPNNITIDPFSGASTSTKSFLGTLVVSGIILAAEIIAFTYRGVTSASFTSRGVSRFVECALFVVSYHGTH